MKRHELWRQTYRSLRDLDHLSAAQLSERLFDCLNNLRVRTERGKLGLLSPEGEGEPWFVWLTETLEECVLRGYDYPGPMTVAPFRSAFDQAFTPIPDMSSVIADRGLAGRPYALKFGEARWLRGALEEGSVRVSTASSYSSADLNHARRDTELERELLPNPSDVRLTQYLTRHPHCDAADGHLRIRSETDYYLFSVSAAYSGRLFGDFCADSCLVILEPGEFFRRVANALRQTLPGWSVEVVPVAYYDPVRIDPREVIVPRCKPFRHAYQREIRVVCTPPVSVSHLAPLDLRLGPLGTCALLVDKTTNPPVQVPPDPRDAPVVPYGVVEETDNMVDHLPDVGRMQGMLLCRDSARIEDWYFDVEYTDKAGAWHALKIPLLDGLYLLNMLRSAEEEQHLSIWNRA
jgi:hypothetical protein